MRKQKGGTQTVISGEKMLIVILVNGWNYSFIFLHWSHSVVPPLCKKWKTWFLTWFLFWFWSCLVNMKRVAEIHILGWALVWCSRWFLCVWIKCFLSNMNSFLVKKSSPLFSFVIFCVTLHCGSVTCAFSEK